ncbi:MAG TPA: alpha/beta hydrolase [Angustibacter sp.]|nr:alpha/beta hydrolase [Angustibacter sp.]
MRPVEVDGHQLERLATTAVALSRRLDAVSTPLLLAARAGGGSPNALVQALRRRTACLGRLRALARVVGLALHVYAATEQALVTAFVRARTPNALPGWAVATTVPAVADDGLVRLLTALSVPELDALLTTGPALAAVVVASDRGDVRPDRRDRLDRLDRQEVVKTALLHPLSWSSARAAPPAARYAANRVLVAADLDAVLTRLRSAPPGPARERLARAVVQRREWLTGSVTLPGADGSVRRRRHQLLHFDPRGDGEVVEVLGDLDRARHVAVFVPGTGSDLQRYPGTLARMVPFAAADPRLAVVVWQGADFPDQPFDDGVLPLREHVVAAAYRDAADRAGPALAADVADLRRSAPAGADVTVLGHSYGGPIVGSALAHGLAVDRVVHVSSAGTYAPVHAGHAQVFSMTAPDDPIQLAQGHDLDDAPQHLARISPPALAPEAAALGVVLRSLVPRDQIGHGGDPDLAPGVIRLDTGRFDDSCRLVRGHSEVFTPGSTAWRNLLATMTGSPVQVLEPARWQTHLAPWSVGVDGGLPRFDPPGYVVDRTPWSDPGYQPAQRRIVP